MNHGRPARIDAVIVTYFPDMETLRTLLRALSGQVRRIDIIDNTPQDDDRVESVIGGLPPGSAECFRLGSNQGIARALNIGIERAREAGATHVLLSDQDSVPAPDMVAGLLGALREQEAAGRRVGAVGPSFLNSVSEISYRFQVRRPGQWTYSNDQPDAAHPHLETLSLITSGMLVPMGVFDRVGLMRDDFFVDHVDIEWCHRARDAGFALFGTAYAHMIHQMGEDKVRIWLFGWRSMNGYRPLRLYYQFRNFVYMLRLRHVPLWWKIRACRYWLGEAYAHLFFASSRLASLRMIVRGCLDGLVGRMGPYPGRWDQRRTRGRP